jgi:hypothetical protein
MSINIVQFQLERSRSAFVDRYGGEEQSATTLQRVLRELA